MKSEIFQKAISSRCPVRFVYGAKEVFVDPYLIHTEHDGRKLLYGRFIHSASVKAFEFKKMANIRIISEAATMPWPPVSQAVN